MSGYNPHAIRNTGHDQGGGTRDIFREQTGISEPTKTPHPFRLLDQDNPKIFSSNQKSSSGPHFTAVNLPVVNGTLRELEELKGKRRIEESSVEEENAKKRRS